MEINHLVTIHLQHVVAQLRTDIHDDPYRTPPPAVIALLRSFRVARRAALSYVAGGSCLPYLEPFLSTITCEETSGAVTQRALGAVLALLRANVLSGDHSTAARAVSEIVYAATHCRCEVTDTSSDEVVILGLVELLQGAAPALSSPALPASTRPPHATSSPSALRHSTPPTPSSPRRCRRL